MKTNNYDNIYLAQIVTFENQSFLFDVPKLDAPFQTEEYRLIFVCNEWAYDMDASCRYRIINDFDIFNDNNLKSDVKYAYNMYSFKDLSDDLKEYLGNEQEWNTYIQRNIQVCLHLHSLLSNQNRVIDFVKVKKLTNERKF